MNSTPKTQERTQNKQKKRREFCVVTERINFYDNQPLQDLKSQLANRIIGK